jgi:hypothetical protein
MIHGEYRTFYTDLCRCQVCTAANTLRTKRQRLRYARSGPQLVPAEPVRKQLLELNKTLSYRKIAALIGIGVANYMTPNGIALGQRKMVNRRVADAIAALYEERCAEVPYDWRRWPTEPLRQAVIARYGSLQASGDPNLARLVNRSKSILTDTAEQCAERHGWLPHELWSDWYTKPHPERKNVA